MNYYEEIKNELIDVEVYTRVKDYSKNKYTLEKYYNVGKILSETNKRYGKGVIREYSVKLSKELGKKYSYKSLNYMLAFYNFQKVQSVTANLSWGHWIELLSIKDINKINYYIDRCQKELLTTRQLRNQIKSNEYERLSDETKLKLYNINR